MQFFCVQTLSPPLGHISGRVEEIGGKEMRGIHKKSRQKLLDRILNIFCVTFLICAKCATGVACKCVINKKNGKK